MKYLSINPNIAKPVCDVQEGTYSKTQIVQISFPGIGKFPVFYSTGFDIGFQKYWGPVTIKKTTTLRAFIVIGNQRSEETKIEYVIEKKEEPKQGKVVLIGGAEHCLEIHKKIIDLAGGPEMAKIAFMPASSSEPYESGKDRIRRFSELGGLIIDDEKVPTDDHGEKDYSSILNDSRFWILPGALIDDMNTPQVDESLWRTNGFKKEFAEKLRDGGYNIVFLTGGNQARYMKCLYYPDGSEGPVLAIIREILEEKGGIVAGTSAGGAFLSRIMILGGSSYGSMIDGVFYQDVIVHDYFDTYRPFKNRVWLGTGAGLLCCDVITDTHFIARGRFGRLITACLYIKKQTGKNIVGIGVDEDTAVAGCHKEGFEVIGASGALIIDTSEAELETLIEPGRYKANNVRLHYLTPGDKLFIDPASGSTSVQFVEPGKVPVTNNKQDNIVLQPDIFGRNRISDWLVDNFIKTPATEIVGFEINDNLEDSSDSIYYYKDAKTEKSFSTFKQYYDLEKYGSALIRFRKADDTESFSRKTNYQWWGFRDRNYPYLKDEEVDTVSFKNVYADVMHLHLLNYPDLSDGFDIPLKSEYTDRLDSWNKLFEENKKSKFGLIVIPKNSHILQVKTFIYEYAYADNDRNGRYSPPRLMERYETDYRGIRFDYDIVNVGEIENAKVYIDNKLCGNTDQFGHFEFVTRNRFVDIRVVFESEGRQTELEMKNLLLPIREAVMKFSENPS